MAIQKSISSLFASSKVTGPSLGRALDLSHNSTSAIETTSTFHYGNSPAPVLSHGLGVTVGWIPSHLPVL